MPDTRWGASPEEWLAFSNHLGLAADLLPVVSNPAAHISAGSTLAALGKVPSRYNRDGDATGIAKWTAQHSTKSQIAAWQREPDYGICLQTRRVRAIDIDIGEADVVEEVLDMIDEALGALPRRWRADSAKCLLLLDLPMAEPLPKRVLRLGDVGAIEFLADGQQCIVAGTHPKGERYQWVGGVPEAVPRGTLGELDVLWQALEQRFAVRGDLVRTGAAPSRLRVSADAADPAVAWLGEHWHVKSLAADGRMAVACPWEAEHTEGTGSETATTYFPAGVGGFDRGNFKCLHAHCASRGVGEFFAAVGYDDTVGEMEVIEEASPLVLPVADPFADRQWPAFERRKDGGIEATMHNTVRCVARPDLCGARVAFDRFKDGVMIAWRGDQGWRPLKDNDYTALRVELEKRGFVKIGKEMVRDAVLSVADTEQFDSAQQWAESLVHDGRPRVDTFLTDFYGVPDSPYARAVSAYIWTALAGRALVPGVKADMVPVFISSQGTGKTTSVECLAPEESAFVEIDLDKRETDTARMMRGKLVGEIAELKGLVGKEAEAVRAWVTKRTEAWIPKYVEFECTYKRRLLMIGTGNIEFLDDDTGERRWLPVRVGTVDVEGIRAVRDQLWAEGVARFKASGIAWQDAQTLAVNEHAAFKIGDEWDSVIEAWLERDHVGGAEGEPRSAGAVRMFDVMVSALGIQVQHMRRIDETRAGKCMRRLGYEKRDQRVGSRVVKAWFKASKV